MLQRIRQCYRGLDNVSGLDNISERIRRYRIFHYVSKE